MPIVLPAGKLKLISVRILLPLMDRETFSKSILPFTSSKTTGFSCSIITGSSANIFFILLYEANAAARSFDSQPSISIGHTMFIEYSVKAPKVPSEISPLITCRPPKNITIIGRSLVIS